MNYTIETVARLTGISSFTLRNWEKRYDFLKPKRMDNGFRTYDNSHVELLKRVFDLVRSGAKIGALADTIKKGRQLPEIRIPEFSSEIFNEAQALYTALLQYDKPKAEQLHNELIARVHSRNILDYLYAPLIAKIGKNWNEDSSNSAQEYFASSFIRFKLIRYLENQEAPSSVPTQQILLASTSGELHEPEVLLLLATLRVQGWNALYLGSGIPADDLVRAANTLRPSIVCVSFRDSHSVQIALPALVRIHTRVAITGFGALTYDSDDSLSPQISILKNSGKEIETELSALLAGSNQP